MQRFKIHTLGCKVNQYEGQGIREQLMEAGYQEAKPGEAAELVVVNSCTVTAEADRESQYWVRRLKRDNPSCQVLFTGCGAATVKTEADWVVPHEKKSSIVEIISGCFESTGLGRRDFAEQPVSTLSNRQRAFLKIQDGCDNICSFCKIRIARGPSRSRQLGEIIEEASRLVQNGHGEIVLTGILLGRWGQDLSDKSKLVRVLEKLCDIEGLERIRLSSIEPEDITDELIDFAASHQQICPHFHVPLQSGDDEILKAMRRNYDSQFYIGRIEQLRERISQFCLTCDVMVGFPGETEQHKQNTLATLKRVQPLKIHFFPYSQRKGTYAEKMPNQLSTEQKKSRLREMADALQPIHEAVRRQFIGHTVDVLVEDASEKDLTSARSVGRAHNYLRVFSNELLEPGSRANFLLQDLHHDGLWGKLIS